MNIVNLSWNLEDGKLNWWNESCAMVVEHFGLPGDRYTTEVSADYMKFFFKTEQDTLMCNLLLSDRL
jgi:hypothetical protein